MTGRPNQVAVALGSIGTGAAVGGSIVTAGLLALRASQGSSPGSPGSLPGDVQATLFMGSLFVGLVGAVTTAYRLSPAITDGWRRALTAALAGFAACFVSFLAAPAELVGGRVGLVAYQMAAVLGAIGGWRFTRDAGRSEPAVEPDPLEHAPKSGSA